MLIDNHEAKNSDLQSKPLKTITSGFKWGIYPNISHFPKIYTLLYTCTLQYECSSDFC
uniref:Uncharacterized protein n=1 Tax=Anguilla anguilla TaxID=7936 RepID=A0A0E9WY26_ANGAN